MHLFAIPDPAQGLYLFYKKYKVKKKNRKRSSARVRRPARWSYVFKKIQLRCKIKV